MILPNQKVSAGVVRFNIIEGKAGEINIKTDGRLNLSYMSDPLLRSTRSILNVFKLEERLQILQQDVRIKHIDARLEPTANKGQAILNVNVVDKTGPAMLLRYQNDCHR